MKQDRLYEENKEEIKAAIDKNDAEKFTEAQVNFMNQVKDDIYREYEEIMNTQNHQVVMASRGINPLTKEETTFYNSLADGTATLDDMEALMPVTIINRIFEELEGKYELLKVINFQNVTGVTEFITRTSDTEAAWWGPLCDEIKKKLEASFEIKDVTQYKLSAYVPICKAMLDLGPEWLDRFVRTILAESIYMALEDAIIGGDGDKKPIGMLKNLDGAVTKGVYPDKGKIKLTGLTPGELGKNIMAPLTKEGKRNVGEVLIIVNPLDYWEKIFPQTTYLSLTGTYVYGVLPIKAKIIESPFVPKGTMIAGVAEDYDMLIGSERKVEFSDHYRFLEDERTYITKQYAYGQPRDNESFLVFDISEMTLPEIPETPEA